MTRRSDRVLALAVMVVAGLAFLPGTLLTLEWIDQGQILYPAWRAAHGALVYRDVRHGYGPSVFYLNAALLRLGGDDLLAVRLGLLVVKAAIAGLIFHLGRLVASRGIALAIAGLFVAVWSAPLWIYATPYASHYAILAGFGGVAILLARPLGAPWTALAAGMAFGIAATFKQTTGLFMETAALVALSAARGGAHSWWERWLARLLPVASALLIVAYLGKDLRTATALVLGAVPLVGLAIEAMRPRGDDAGRSTAVAVIVCGVGFVLPLLLWAGVYASLGQLGALVDGLVRLPQRVTWFVPLPEPHLRWAIMLATILLGWGTLIARRRGWFGDVAVAMLGLAALAVMAIVTGGFAPSLATTYLPLAIVIGAGPLGLAAGATAARVLWWQGAFMLLSLYPAAEFPHAMMILPGVLPVLALLLGHAWRLAGTPAARFLVAALATGPLLPPVLSAAGLLGIVLAARPSGVSGLPRATGIWDGGPEFERMRGALATVERVAPPGTPLLVLPNAQLAYMLADRVSALDADEIVLYFVGAGLLDPEAAHAMLSEDDALAAVSTRRPAVLLWSKGVALDRIRAAYPRLFELLDRGYRVASEADGARVLVPID